jgi:diamine N-acetyltransferase
MKIIGNNIELIPARESDREKIYTWLAKSNITPCIMGQPDYPDHPIPTWDEFCNDYATSFFNASGDGKGRNYIITIHGEEIGTIGYDLLDKQRDRVLLDIWMRAEKFCGHGFGSDALTTLCNYIHKRYGITNFVISPSARNKRAIAAYKKAGFKYVKILHREEQIDEFGQAEYDDNILMVKRLTTNQSVGLTKIRKTTTL